GSRRGCSGWRCRPAVLLLVRSRAIEPCCRISPGPQRRGWRRSFGPPLLQQACDPVQASDDGEDSAEADDEEAEAEDAAVITGGDDFENGGEAREREDGHPVLFRHRTREALLEPERAAEHAHVGAEHSKHRDEPPERDAERAQPGERVASRCEDQDVGKAVGHLVEEVAGGSLTATFHRDQPVEHIGKQPKLDEASREQQEKDLDAAGGMREEQKACAGAGGRDQAKDGYRVWLDGTRREPTGERLRPSAAAGAGQRQARWMDTWDPQQQVVRIRAEPQLNSQRQDDGAYQRPNDRRNGRLPPISWRHGGDEGDADVRDDEENRRFGESPDQ